MKVWWMLWVGVWLVGVGCLTPKPVEIGQAKVPAYPEPTAREREVLRQTALLAAEKAQETVVAAVAAQSPVTVVAPAEETAVLTEAVSRHVGPPIARVYDVTSAVAQLEAATGRLQAQIEQFRKRQEALAGRPVEGTGWLRIPYLVWVGGVAFVMFFVLMVGWMILRWGFWAAPGVGLGARALWVTASLARRGLWQIVRGGERFKQKLSEILPPEEAQRVRALFRQEQQRAQDADVQELVRGLTQ